MTRNTFREFLHNVFNMTDDILMDRIFKYFDSVNDGSISREEWIVGLNVFLRGDKSDVIIVISQEVWRSKSSTASPSTISMLMGWWTNEFSGCSNSVQVYKQRGNADDAEDLSDETGSGGRRRRGCQGGRGGGLDDEVHSKGSDRDDHEEDGRRQGWQGVLR